MSFKRRLKDKIHKRYFTEYSSNKRSSYNDYRDFSDFENEVVERVKPFTMTSPERIVSLIRAVNYIENNNISGSIVECGVWKGGSMMSALLALNKVNSKDRQLFLYDTYDGMSEPKEVDKSYRDESAVDAFKTKNDYWDRIKCFSSLEEVKNNLTKVNYDAQKIHFVKGKVEDTIPNTIPDKICILRLDTDWYESTLHELKHLYPLLQPGGILIVDDYGHWQGCRKAVDEYFEENQIKMYLSRIDYTCRIGIKCL